jgi:hypothetical protein
VRAVREPRGAHERWITLPEQSAQHVEDPAERVLYDTTRGGFSGFSSVPGGMRTSIRS